MDTEIEKLLSMGVIEKSMHQRDEMISPVFMVLKHILTLTVSF